MHLSQSKISASPTLYQATSFEKAFSLLNNLFFDNRLPCVIINQQHKGSAGYFSLNRWKANREGSAAMHEINLNPGAMKQDTKVIVSNLLHEMVHLWEHYYGHAARSNYHDKQWAEKMLEVGLLPISLDDKNKMTGQRVTHKIIPGGPFDKFINGSSLQIKYYGLPADKTKTKNKVKYTCNCNSHIWGKPGLSIMCTHCNSPFAANQPEAEATKGNENLYSTIQKY